MHLLFTPKCHLTILSDFKAASKLTTSEILFFFHFYFCFSHSQLILFFLDLSIDQLQLSTFDRSPLRLRSNSRSLCFGASSCRWCHQSTSTNWVHFDPWHFPLTKYLVSSRLAKFRSSKFQEIFNFKTLVSRYASLSKWKGQARLNLKKNVSVDRLKQHVDHTTVYLIEIGVWTSAKQSLCPLVKIYLSLSFNLDFYCSTESSSSSLSSWNWIWATSPICFYPIYATAYCNSRQSAHAAVWFFSQNHFIIFQIKGYYKILANVSIKKCISKCTSMGDEFQSERFYSSAVLIRVVLYRKNDNNFSYFYRQNFWYQASEPI